MLHLQILELSVAYTMLTGTRAAHSNGAHCEAFWRRAYDRTMPMSALKWSVEISPL